MIPTPSILGMDGEMFRVKASNGEEHDAICRISIVKYQNDTIVTVLDTWVEMEIGTTICNYRSEITGVDASAYSQIQKKSFEQVHQQVQKIIMWNVVVGHDLINDFKVLRLSHPTYYIRDTALNKTIMRPVEWNEQAERIKKYNIINCVGWQGERKPSLKYLVKHHLNENIQLDTHSSVDDATYALRLYIHKKEEWEQDLINSLNNPKDKKHIVKVIKVIKTFTAK